MAIGIICRHCGARLKVPEKAAGKLGKCPKCKEKIRVPKNIAPEAHFCDRCEKSLAEEQDIHLVSGSIYCGDCFAKLQGTKKKTGDSVLDQLGINLPGMVVLRGSEQRKMGRMLQDVSAKKDFKDKTGALAKPKAPTEAEETAEPEAAPVQEQEETATAPPAEVKEAPKPEAGPEPAAEEAVPAANTEATAAAAPPKLTKGQRPADSLLTKLLVEQGVVLDGELELALQYQRGLGKRLIPVLDDLKLTSEEEIARSIAESTGLEACPAGELEIAPYLHSLLDDEIMSRYEVIPLEQEGDALIAAFPNPLDVMGVKELREALGTRIVPRVCTWSQYTDARRSLKSAGQA